MFYSVLCPVSGCFICFARGCDLGIGPGRERAADSHAVTDYVPARQQAVGAKPGGYGTSDN